MNIIGLNIEKYIGKEVSGHNCDFIYIDKELEKHILYVEEKNKKYELIISAEDGECGSGWTTATFGSLNINEITSFPGMMFRSKDKVDDIKFPVIGEYSDFSDINNKFFSVSIDGGDNYYPMGGYSVNMDMFISNGRGISSSEDIKRKVWVFKGKSGAGKTFLSDKIGFEKYETDSSSELPDILKEDIIVIGNKYKFKVKEIKNKIYESENCDIIVVKFS